MSSAGRESPAQTRREFDFGRTVALSDGVFAIALTLLVISIAVPHLPTGREDELPSRLVGVLPQVFSYGFSFAVIARMWGLHHHLFADLARIDGRVAGLNMAYLAVVAFIPYPTQLLGEYGDQSIAAAIYAATIAAVSGLGVVMRRHAQRAGLFRPDAAYDPGRRSFVPLVFLVSVPIAFLSPFAAEGLWFVSMALPRSR